MQQRPPPSPHSFGFRPSETPIRNTRKRKPSWDDESTTPPSASGSPFSPFASGNKRNRTGPLDQSLFQRLQALHTEHEQQQLVQAQQQQQTTPPSLERVLGNLNKEQLVEIISTLVQKHPDLQSELSELIPRPTLNSAAALITQAEKALAEAFPYSKFGSERSDYAFNRVRPQLEGLQQLIYHYLDHFVSPESYPTHMQHEYPGTAFGYLHLATSVAHRLPLWQSEMHNNATKGQLYEKLGRRWGMAVAEVGKFVKEGKVYGSAAVGEWARNLHQHSLDVKGEYGFGEAFEEFKRHLGWLIGLHPAGQDDFAGGGSVFTGVFGHTIAYPMAAS